MWAAMFYIVVMAISIFFEKVINENHVNAPACAPDALNVYTALQLCSESRCRLQSGEAACPWISLLHLIALMVPTLLLTFSELRDWFNNREPLELTPWIEQARGFARQMKSAILSNKLATGLVGFYCFLAVMINGSLALQEVNAGFPWILSFTYSIFIGALVAGHYIWKHAEPFTTIISSFSRYLVFLSVAVVASNFIPIMAWNVMQWLFLIHYYALLMHMCSLMLSSFWALLYHDFYVTWQKVGHGDFKVQERSKED
jgi:hypothetical protein